MNRKDLIEIVIRVFEYHYGIKPRIKDVTLLESDENGYYIFAKIGTKEYRITNKDNGIRLPRFIPFSAIETTKTTY